MALFDLPNALSTEVPSGYQLADRLSECSAFWDLVEAIGVDDIEKTADARTRIEVGHIYEPLDGNEFTVKELEQIWTIARVGISQDESYQSALSDSLIECPQEGGIFSLYLRRQVRKSELKDDDGRNDVLLFFWDRVSAIAKQLFIQTEISATTTPRIMDITRDVGPAFNTYKSAVSQGDYIMAILSVSWGNIGQGSSA